MRHARTRTALLLALTVVAGLAPLASAAPTLKGRAVWANPREAGLTEASVVAYVEQLAQGPRQHADHGAQDLRRPLLAERAVRSRGRGRVQGVRPAGGAHPRVSRARDRVPRLVLRLRRGRQLLRRAAAPGVAGPEPRGQAHERRGPAGPALPHGLDVPGATARLHRPVAHPRDQGVRGALRRGRHPPRLRALPGRPRPRHVLLLRLLPGGDPEVRLLLLDDPPRPPPPRAHGPPPPRGALGEEPEGPAAELEGLRARDEEPAPPRGELLPGRQPRPRLLLLRVPGAPVAAFTRAGVRGGAEGEAADGVLGRGRSRTPCRAAASSGRTGGASRRGSSTSCRWTTAATTPGTSRPTSTCSPRASSSRRSGRATSRTSGPASRPTSSTTRSGSRSPGSAGSSATGARTSPRCRRPSTRSLPGSKTYAPELHDALAAYLKEPKSPEAPAAKLDAFLANVPEGYYPPERLTKVARARARPGRRGRRHLLVRRDHLGPPLEGGRRSSSAK